MGKDRNIHELYKNKKILGDEQTTLLQQIDAMGAEHPYKLLYFISDFERQNYWESAINRFDTDQKSAMHHCVDLLIAAHPHKPRGNKEIKLSPWEPTPKNENPWVRAVKIFLSLVNAGASINSRKIHQFDIFQTPLGYAIAQGAPRDVLELLIKHGAYVNEFEFCCHTPLMSAIYHLHVDAVDVLCRAGADLTAKYEDGTPLLQQVMQQIYHKYDFDKCRRIIETLLKYGANPNTLDSDMETAMEFGTARFRGSRFMRETDMDIAKEMIELRALMKKYAKNFPAPRRTRAQYIKRHTWYSTDPKTGKRMRDTSKAEHAWSNLETMDFDDKINKYLLAERPLPVQWLWRAIKERMSNYFLFDLVHHCSDINRRDARGQTALHHCAGGNVSMRMARKMLFCGADALVRDNNGKIAFDLIKESGVWDAWGKDEENPPEDMAEMERLLSGAEKPMLDTDPDPMPMEGQDPVTVEEMDQELQKAFEALKQEEE